MESHEMKNVANNVALNAHAILKSSVLTTNEGIYRSIGRLLNLRFWYTFMVYFYFEVF